MILMKTISLRTAQLVMSVAMTLTQIKRPKYYFYHLDLRELLLEKKPPRRIKSNTDTLLLSEHNKFNNHLQLKEEELYIMVGIIR
mmetsp:Transcript_29732/g.55103  ORF Transcript_29732/g.55103 Transcript_29732/m.55103 type:complete len:85 (-) Transcript_29732:106-360(-)